MKKNEGITLIALIITIIILIILTAVTINNVIGTDLIGFATKAVENYTDAEKEEDKINELMSQGGSAVSGLPIPSGNGGLSTLVTAENYGDYIDYPVDIGIGQPGTQDDWKIFYDNGTNIFIIAADYVPTKDNEETKIKTAAEKANMTNCAYFGNLEYCWFWSKVPDYQTIPTVPTDIEDLFGLKKWKVSDLLHKDLTNSKCVSTLLNKEHWQGFLDEGQNYGEYAVGGATVEMWCESWNAAHDSCKIYAEAGSNYGYILMGSGMESEEKWTPHPSEIDAVNDSLWYPRFGIEHLSDVENCQGYWLASPCEMDQEFLFVIRYDGELGGCNPEGASVALRPIICLNSKVSATKVGNVWKLE